MASLHVKNGGKLSELMHGQRADCTASMHVLEDAGRPLEICVYCMWRHGALMLHTHMSCIAPEDAARTQRKILPAKDPLCSSCVLLRALWTKIRHSWLCLGLYTKVLQIRQAMC